MKKVVFKFSLFILGVVLILISYFTQPSAGINNAVNNISMPDSQFQIGAFSFHVPNNYRFTQLGFNVWHDYTQLNRGWNDDINDNYLDTINSPGIITARLSINNTDNLRTYFDRPIVEYVIAGQRVDYECESINTRDSLFWFNKYNFVGTSDERLIYEVQDTSKYGKYEEIPYGSSDTARVIYCKRDNNNPESNAGYIDSSLYANRNLSYDLAANGWSNASAYDWYVMPRIRIDSIYAANSSNDTDTICRIEILGWDGQLIQNVPLRIKNFKTRNNYSEYYGDYLEYYHFDIGQDTLGLPKSVIASSFVPANKADVLNWKDKPCNVDIRIYWTGKCDMWIDRVRVENEPAHQYLTLKDNRFISKVNREAVLSVTDYSITNHIPNYFYFEECTINHFPAIRALNKQIMAATTNQNSLLVWLNNFQVNALIPFPDSNRFHADEYSRLIKDYCGMPALVLGWYGLEGWQDTLPGRFSYHPNTLTSDGYDVTKRRLSYPTNSSTYENWLQNKFDADYSATYNVILVDKIMDTLSRNGLRVINCPQAHSFYMEGGPLKEPTNEEIELQVGLALTYNAKGMMFYSFDSHDESNGWSFGIMDLGNDNPRTSTCYLQNKFEQIGAISNKLNKWGPYFMKFNPSQTKSCIYRFQIERDNFFPGSYLNDASTSLLNPNTQCAEIVPNTLYETQNTTFLQVATFDDNTSDKDNYFMVVNRRCTPGDDDCSGRRFVSISLKSNRTEFSGFNNWKIIDLFNDSTVYTFDKRISNNISLGKYKPGEGKLYKIAPVMTEGGTFVCNEEVIPSTFVCDSTVFNNNHELRLYQGTTVKFNPKGKIVFSGGSFYSGILPQNSSPLPTEFSGNNCYWEGISFIGGTDIHISNSVFKNITYEPPGGSLLQSQNCALSIINCNDITINSSQFYMDNKSGAIYYQYNSYENPRWENAYIGGNTFTISQSNNNSPLVTSFSSLSAIETPIRLEGNYFNNISGTPAIAAAVNGVCGGTIKNNNFYKFSDGVIAANSSIDLYNNRFYSNIASSKSIQGFSESNLNMSPNDEYYLGGYNRIYTMNEESKNVYVDNSFVFLENGDNTFNISEYSGIGEKPYHIFGTFPSINEQQYPAAYNCFKIDSIDAEAFVEVTVNGTPIEFNFYSYSCNAMLSGDYEVVSIEGLVNDTIALKHTGQGGSEKGNGGNGNEMQVSRCKTLSDSINISIRKRQYTVTEQKCIELLNLFPDSTASFDALNKLYLSSLLQDSAGSKMAPLKTFYETVILNNPGKEKLINRCFYLIQKCKVSLKQYTSALEGFNLIIQQNPYTYEGLVASWDFAATHLLDSIGGSSGGYNGKTEEKLLTAFDITNRYDSTKFTKKQRIEISKSVNDILENKRITQTEKIETLQKKSEEGNREATKELHTMKRLSETVKTKKPGNNSELQGIIQSDIKKVFSRVDNNTTESVSIIPQTYQLYQNYPNPFNPTTKIAFDLPKDSKVKLVIYDILGREMKTLVNNEFRSAGKYITEFNGSNMASGVYFARILVNEGKDFIAVKKMVFLK